MGLELRECVCLKCRGIWYVDITKHAKFCTWCGVEFASWTSDDPEVVA